MNRETEIRTLLVEDEQIARDRLRNALGDYRRLRIIGDAENGLEAIESIRTLNPDLVFLDVQMPRLNGVEVVQQLEDPPMIVFTTAHDEYAIKAFEVHAVDYLLKPYGRERLQLAVSRAIDRFDAGERSTEGLSGFIDAYHTDAGYLERICVRERHTYKVIDIADADLFLAEDGLTFLYTDGEKHMVDSSLNHLEQQLDQHRFYRVHRNAIVNLDRIGEVVPWGQGKLALHLSGDQRVFVSRHRMQEFKRRIGLKLQ